LGTLATLATIQLINLGYRRGGAITVDNQTLRTTQNTPIAVTLNVTEGGQQNLSYQLGLPANGSLTGTAPDLVYRPAPSYVGIDDFTYSVSDGTVSSDTAVVTVIVTGS
jgi:hypothetical protein